MVKKWHYLGVKKLSALLRGVTSNQNGDFYCLIFFHSYSTEKKREKHEKECKDIDYCFVEMPNNDIKILKCNPGEKSMKVPFIVYADLECLLEKMNFDLEFLFEKKSSYHNNLEKSYTDKEYVHILSCYSIFTHCSFDATKNMLHCYRSKDYEIIL